MRNFYSVHPKALEDLEFNQILNKITDYAFSIEAKEKINSIKPYGDLETVKASLSLTNEYLTSFESNNSIPYHFIPSIKEFLKKLQIENAYIDPKNLLIISNAVETIIQLNKFFNKFENYFPFLLGQISCLKLHPEIAKQIRKKINNYGEIVDNASLILENIRRQIRELQKDILKVFLQEKQKYDKAGYLSDIKESILDNRNVLAVSSVYRKNIKGTILGTSKTGSIVFIEPEALNKLHKDLFGLFYDEKQEVKKILIEITNKLRPYYSVLKSYDDYLINLEVIASKAKFAAELDAVKPRISEDNNLSLIKAYHPILKITNKKLGISIIPQDIKLNNQQRIIIISGPNAGGKSISLKTVGLLQVMFQSGILIPVHPDSEIPVYKNILTDIGDNQSIENQLSTYSYRLKNMRNFLRKINENTLFLIDEFGTGSDPEMGGALAEAFLEEFYKNKAFGIITTHYNNLKLIAEKYPEIVNAHMEFDIKKLQPTYHLHIGQAGSSFTFEVAQKIGIPYRIINKAKNKVSKNKLKFDETLSKMQKEIKQMKKIEKEYIIEKKNLLSEQDKQMQLSKDLLKKLNKFNRLYQLENKTLQQGEKIQKLFEDYYKSKNIKNLTSKVFKWAEIERTKKDSESYKSKMKKKSENKKTKEKIKKYLADKDVVKELEKIEIKTMKFTPKINDQVRIKGSQSNATIEKIEKNKVLLNYGKFRAWAPLKELELVIRK